MNMFWNKKEGEKILPDLSAIHTPFKDDFGMSHESLSDSSESEDSGPNILPTFPDSPASKGFSQNAIKESINNSDLNEFKKENFEKIGKPEDAPKYKTIEMEDEYSKEKRDSIFNHTELKKEKELPDLPVHEEKISIPVKKEMPVSPSFKPKHYNKPSNEKDEDIYVRIDKFQSAKKSLKDIQNNLADIESLLSKIREVKLREEQELSSWEKNLVEVKTHVKEVTEGIFEKI